MIATVLYGGPRFGRTLDHVHADEPEVGNPGGKAELTLVRSAADANPVVRKEIVRTLDTLRRDVAGSNSSVLERLLAGRVAIRRLLLSVAERTYHQALERELSQRVTITGIVT